MLAIEYPMPSADDSPDEDERREDVVVIPEDPRAASALPLLTRTDDDSVDEESEVLDLAGSDTEDFEDLPPVLVVDEPGAADQDEGWLRAAYMFVPRLFGKALAYGAKNYAESQGLLDDDSEGRMDIADLLGDGFDSEDKSSGESTDHELSPLPIVRSANAIALRQAQDDRDINRMDVDALFDDEADVIGPIRRSGSERELERLGDRA